MMPTSPESKTSFGESMPPSERPRTPEWIANPPLEHTTLIYSVPVYGEWSNGHVLRMLQGMLSQRVERGQAMEVELVANLGYTDRYAIDVDEVNDDPEAIARREKHLDKIQQTEEIIAFIERIVEIQAFAREALFAPNKDKRFIVQHIQQIAHQIIDPIQRDIAYLAAKRSNEISIALINATKMDFAETPYQLPGLPTARTIGIDAACARFKDHDNVAISLFDADTVPLDTHTVQDIQRLYASDPNISYVFFSISDFVKGTSRMHAGDPGMTRHVNYNTNYGHGSPQHSFRLRAYKQLREIASFELIGDEDRDTGIRLIYHFGQLQDGLLFQASKTLFSSSPRVLTEDRRDGFMDGQKALDDAYTEKPSYNIEKDLNEILNYREEILQKIEALPPLSRHEAYHALFEARKTELHRERVQQRMNRLVVRAFFQALRQGWVSIDRDTLTVQESALTQLQGGKALQLFLRTNPDLIKELLHHPEDVALLKYDAGLTDVFPTGLGQRTHFQQAMRDYMGEVRSCEELHTDGLIFDTWEPGSGHKAQDNRSLDARVSLWHGMTAELLALGHVYRVFFQTEQFFDDRKDHLERWPKNPEKQELPWHFGSMEERVETLKKQHTQQARPISRTKYAEPPWYERFSFHTIPGFALFQRLLKRR